MEYVTFEWVQSVQVSTPSMPLTLHTFFEEDGKIHWYQKPVVSIVTKKIDEYRRPKKSKGDLGIPRILSTTNLENEGYSYSWSYESHRFIVLTDEEDTYLEEVEEFSNGIHIVKPAGYFLTEDDIKSAHEQVNKKVQTKEK